MDWENNNRMRKYIVSVSEDDKPTDDSERAKTTKSAIGILVQLTAIGIVTTVVIKYTVDYFKEPQQPFSTTPSSINTTTTLPDVTWSTPKQGFSSTEPPELSTLSTSTPSETSTTESVSVTTEDITTSASESTTEDVTTSETISLETTSHVETTEDITTETVTEILTTETVTEEVTTETVTEEVTTAEGTTEAPEEPWPYTYGPNLDLGEHVSPGGFRKGQASDNHTCGDVRGVPEELRSDEVMYKGIAQFYQKYTEAYGIPVLGSINVTDEGLRRACYIVRIMLASRYDIRNTMYKFYIRVALIGDDEQTTSLWEYRDFDSEYWDKRARGLGATVQIPLASAGDDNARCRLKDRYPNNEILVHEFAHGVHHFGATFAIPRFEVRLKALYTAAKTEGKYGTSYMGTNRNEYWAVGSEIFMESFEGGGYVYNISGTMVALRDRHSLALYDPGLVDLLKEVYTCPNTLRSRCQFKRSPDCSVSNFQLTYEWQYRVIVNCPKDRTFFNLPTLESCVAKACHRQKKVFGYASNGKCVTYNCPDVNFEFKQGGIGFDIYTLQVPFHPPAYAESEIDLQQLCTKPMDIPGRCNVTEEERVTCGPDIQTATQCEARGCCYQDNRCFYSVTSTCTNKLYYCPGDAADNRCESNRYQKMMKKKCAMSCDMGVCLSFKTER